jgi:hypothetical protein
MASVEAALQFGIDGIAMLANPRTDANAIVNVLR